MAPTDSEHGEIPAQGLARQGQLEAVPLGEYGPEGRMRRLAVERGIDVGPARQHEPGHVVEERGRVLRAAGGEDEGQAAPRLHGPDVVVAEAEDLGLLAGVLDRDPDGRPPHMRSGTGIPRTAASTAMCRTNASTTSVRKARRSSDSACRTE